MKVAAKIRHCPSCSKDKSTDKFYTSGGRPHGYCKACAKDKEKARHRQNVADIFGEDEVARRDAVRRKKASAAPGNKVCARCLDERPVDQFYPIKGGGRESYCTVCRSAYDKARFAKSPRSRLVTLLGAARRRAINNGRAFDLELEDLVTLWEDQEGRCRHTGIPLSFDGTRSPEALSIDRVDSSAGYTRENVVLCCRRVNEMKREMTIDDLRRWCLLILSGTGKKE